MTRVKDLKDILGQFPSKKIMVLGDLIADEYIFTHCSRVSREAPVLILRYENKKVVLGGGANAINNIRSLGAQVLPIGIVGQDEMGACVLKIMAEKKIPTEFIYRHEKYPTTTKTRVLAGSYHTTKQQVVRIDREPDTSLDNNQAEEFIIHSIEKNINQVDALLVSDYGLGACSGRIKDRINRIAAQNNKIITVDSRYETLSYHGVTALTPNEPEIEQALQIEIKDESNVAACGRLAIEKTGCQAILITRGKKGAFLLEKSGHSCYIPVYGEDEVSDVTGAGDTVISTLTLALTAGATMLEAARLANYAGGIVVMKSGTAPIYWEELSKAVENETSGGG